MPYVHLVQELLVSVDKIFMVAELLARSPDSILGSLSPTMENTPGMSSDGEYVKPGVAEMQTMEISIRGGMVKVGIAGVSMILGVSVVTEAKDAVVDGFTHVFGKYQVKTADDISELNDISDDGLDGTPDTDATQQQQQQLAIQDDSDVATTSVSFKKVKFEALVSNQITKATDTANKQKQAQTDELIEAQQAKVQKFMNEVMDVQLAKHKVELQQVLEQCRQQSLEA